MLKIPACYRQKNLDVRFTTTLKNTPKIKQFSKFCENPFISVE